MNPQESAHDQLIDDPCDRSMTHALCVIDGVVETIHATRIQRCDYSHCLVTLTIYLTLFDMLLCMLSIYDDVVGGRSDRWSAALSDSLKRSLFDVR
jgi:hypothetical protein